MMIRDIMKFQVVFWAAVIFLSGCTPAAFDRDIGRAYLGAEDYGAAISEFQKAVSKEPGNGFNHFWLGKAYFDKGQYKDAITHLKRATELQPNNAYHLLMLGNAYMKTQQYQDAITALKKAIEIEPAETFFKELGYCYIKLQNYDEAITALKRAIELKPGSVAYNNLGYAYGEKKQYDEAFKAFRKAMELAPQDAVTPALYGAFLMEKGDYAEAERQYKRAVSLQPNNAYYLLRLSYVCYRQGKYDEAFDAADKSANLSTFTGVGLSFQITDNYPVIASATESGPAKGSGIKVGDRIIRVDGKSTKGWTAEKMAQNIKGQKGTRVVFSIERKDTKRPLEIAVTREKIIPTEALSAIGIRSLSQRHRGKLVGALQDAEQAYSLDSSDIWAKIPIGAAYLDRGKYAEAIELLATVKDNVTARILEATAHAKQGNFKQAVAIYSAIPEEKLSTNNIPLWTDRTALLVAFAPYVSARRADAGTLQSQGRDQEALGVLGDALMVADEAQGKELFKMMAEILRAEPQLARVPEEARKYTLRGEMMAEEGKIKEAAEQFRLALNIAPYIAKLHFKTAIIYGELQRYSQATRYMKTYLLLAPEAPNARAAQDQIYKWEFMIEQGG